VGVTVTLDDELGRLGPEVDFRDVTVRRFNRPDGLIRLTPSGACSVGAEILREVGPTTPVWRPAEVAPHKFIRDLIPTSYRPMFMEAAE
jgi:hypothetical protein